MANSADPDELASEEANWSGSTLFAKAGYIWVQQDKGTILDIPGKLNTDTLSMKSDSGHQASTTLLFGGTVNEEYLKIILEYFFLISP